MAIAPPIESADLQNLQQLVDLLAEPLPVRIDADPDTLRYLTSVLHKGLAEIEPLIDAIREQRDCEDPALLFAALQREVDEMVAAWQSFDPRCRF
jgi:hypothetical protein